MKELLTLEILIPLLLLAISQVANIILGAVKAEFKDKWNIEIFKRGVVKALAVFLGITVIALGAKLDPNLVFNDVPIIEYVITAIKLGYVYYFGQVVIKILEFIAVPSAEKEVE